LALHIGESYIDGFATDGLTETKHFQQFGVPYAVHLSRVAIQ
jgi:hypothetical protein